MQAGLAIVESMTRMISETWRTFSSSEGITFLMMGVLIGFALAMILGLIGSRRVSAKPARGKSSEKEPSAGSVGLSRGMSA